jgi:hypothetical protein
MANMEGERAACAIFTPCLFLLRNERDLLLDLTRRLINGEASGLQARYQTLGKGVF